MKTYAIRLTGKTPLLMHHDNVEWSDEMAEWLSNPDNKKLTKAGDDRTPAFGWLGKAYHDGTHLAIPSANIMRALMEGGAMVPTGVKQKTFKAQTQSGMMSNESFWTLLVNGAQVPWSPLLELRSETTFTEHRKRARSMGFDLFIKRAKIGQTKHVRVRPKFDPGWEVVGSLSVWDEQITKQALSRIFEYAGQYKGLGDWRPGGRTPGPYGTFTAEIK